MSKKKQRSTGADSIESRCAAAEKQHKAKQKQENECEPISLFTHEEYLSYLDMIESDTAKIVLVQPDGINTADPIIKTAQKKMPLEAKRRTNEWYGTITLGTPGMEYTFTKTTSFFDYLRTFESFFIETNEIPYEFRLTQFGNNDIAFIDKNGDLLFYTTTHEGDAYLNGRYNAR